MVGRAPSSEALDDGREHARLQLAGAQVIEKEQRLGAEHGNIVHTVVHEVFANRVVPVHREGNLQLRTHAIHAGDQHRLAVAPGVQCKKSYEPADLSEHLAATCRSQQPG